MYLPTDASLQDRWYVSCMPPPLSPDVNQPLDITIKLADGRSATEMQLKISADIKEKKYEIRMNKDRIIRRVSNEKMFVHSF